jgi:uncharacterized RDD family membrane protein YckC
MRSDRTSRNNPNHIVVSHHVNHEQQMLVQSFADHGLREAILVSRIFQAQQRIHEYFTSQSNETPCFLRFVAAFSLAHSNDSPRNEYRTSTSLNVYTLYMRVKNVRLSLGIPTGLPTRRGTLFTNTTVSTTAQKIPSRSGPRRFHAHETARAKELEGLPLATFWQRLLGYTIDLLLAVFLWAPLEILWRIRILHEHAVHVVWDFHEPGNIVFALLYFGLFNFLGNGRTPGKWLARTRAVSLNSRRLGLWQSIERSLGYGAAVLEGGLGFLQFFWSANRMCAQDRLAETIVIDERRRSVQPSV